MFVNIWFTSQSEWHCALIAKLAIMCNSYSVFIARMLIIYPTLHFRSRLKTVRTKILFLGY